MTKKSSSQRPEIFTTIFERHFTTKKNTIHFSVQTTNPSIQQHGLFHQRIPFHNPQVTGHRPTLHFLSKSNFLSISYTKNWNKTTVGLLTSEFSPSAETCFFSGTRITCPGNTVRDGNRFNMASSDGVVSKRAATDVRVSQGSTWNHTNTIRSSTRYWKPIIGYFYKKYSFSSPK